MKYLDAKFTVGPPIKSTACERCVYGRGRHAQWCDHRPLMCEECSSLLIEAKVYDKFYCRVHRPRLTEYDLRGLRMTEEQRRYWLEGSWDAKEHG